LSDLPAELDLFLLAVGVEVVFVKAFCRRNLV
jgi:hypothetical protein